MVNLVSILMNGDSDVCSLESLSFLWHH